MKYFVPILLLAAAAAIAQTKTPVSMPLWAHGAPGALGTAGEDTPALIPFLVASPNGTAVVVCPGGGYVHLSMEKEGYDIARWLNSLGIAAFVLKYRLGPKYHHPVMLEDAQRAIRVVRALAPSIQVHPDRIGIWGFSAGGHLASTAETHFDAGDPNAADPGDRPSSRPDFAILSYPVISLDSEYAHIGSRNALLGDHPDPKLLKELSNDEQVTAQTPPTFLFHTTADTTVPVENSIRFYLALRKAGVPAEMHIFQNGAHGAGLGSTNATLSVWPELLANWLRERGLLR